MVCKMITQCEHFDIDELVSPEILATLSETACWTLVRPWIGQLDMIRRLYGGPLWLNSNGRKYAGIRPRDCMTGAKQSRHKLVLPHVSAWDFVCNDLAKLEKIIRDDYKIIGAVRMENPKITKTWLHVELSSAICPPNLVVFDP